MCWRAGEFVDRFRVQPPVIQAQPLRRRVRLRTVWRVNFRKGRGCRTERNCARLKRHWCLPDFRLRQSRNFRVNWTEWDLWQRRAERHQRAQTMENWHREIWRGWWWWRGAARFILHGPGGQGAAARGFFLGGRL